MLMLTVRDGLQHTVEGRDAGADDYLTRPFEVDELLARLRTLLRQRTAGAVLCFAERELDQSTRDVRRGKHEILPTPTGFALLQSHGEPRLIHTHRRIGYALRKS